MRWDHNMSGAKSTPVQSSGALRRVCVGLLGALLVTGCAVSINQRPPIEPLAASALQDPLAGQAVVYLIRAPHDRAEVSFRLGDAKKVVLPPATYAVVHLPPSIYRITSTAISDREGAEPQAAEAVLNLVAGQRRFFYTSRASITSSSLELIPIGGGGFVPLFGRQSQVAGQRFWRECSELDALGMLSIAVPVAIERQP